MVIEKVASGYIDTNFVYESYVGFPYIGEVCKKKEDQGYYLVEIQEEPGEEYVHLVFDRLENKGLDRHPEI